MGSLRELLLLVGLVALITTAMGSRWAPLLYPLALLSVAGALMMLALVEHHAGGAGPEAGGPGGRLDRDALPLLIAGLALALLELLAIDLPYTPWLTVQWGSPLLNSSLPHSSFILPPSPATFPATLRIDFRLRTITPDTSVCKLKENTHGRWQVNSFHLRGQAVVFDERC